MFSTNCTNKGCCKLMEPYIDPKNDKVYCSLCDKEIVNITHFAKMQMKSLKQYKKKCTDSFSVKCPHCNKEGRPKVLNNDITCSSCKKPLSHLTHAFKLMLKQYLKTAEQDIS